MILIKAELEKIQGERDTIHTKMVLLKYEFKTTKGLGEGLEIVNSRKIA